MDCSSKKKLNVLMLPWLAHGHAYRYLELGKRLVQELDHLHVHFCSTPVILESVRDHLHRYFSTVTNSLSSPSPQSRINLVQIHLPDLPELPPHLHSTKHLPSHLIPMLSRAFAQSEQNFSQIVETLNPDLLIFDVFQPWAAKIARRSGIPTVVYLGCMVAMSWAAHRYFNKEYPFPAISITEENQRPMKNPEEDAKRFRRSLETVVLSWQLSDFVITRSFREAEAKYIDYVSTVIGKEVVPTGPLMPDISSVSPGDSEVGRAVMRWLDKREKRSVVLVSFGSECFMPYEEMEWLAHGLERSGACFIWVARFPKMISGKLGTESDYDDIGIAAEGLIHGLVERVGPERALVITSWAPQRRILVHPNLGAFLTHCGWSSVIEGMHAGVPMLALPMNWDQPMNAKLVVELGVGVEIPQRGLGNFEAEDVAALIKVVLESEIGADVRRNAENLAAVIRDRKDDDFRFLANKIVELASNVQAA